MAWWTLFKWFSSFRTTPFVNMIKWYSYQLYKEWYESLSDEEKEYYLKESEKRKARENQALDQLFATYNAIANRFNNIDLFRI